MSESSSQSPATFTPDLFSPLQFCEVVEEGSRRQLSALPPVSQSPLVSQQSQVNNANLSSHQPLTSSTQSITNLDTHQTSTLVSQLNQNVNINSHTSQNVSLPSHISQNITLSSPSNHSCTLTSHSNQNVSSPTRQTSCQTSQSQSVNAHDQINQRIDSHSQISTTHVCSTAAPSTDSHSHLHTPIASSLLLVPNNISSTSCHNQSAYPVEYTSAPRKDKDCKLQTLDIMEEAGEKEIKPDMSEDKEKNYKLDQLKDLILPSSLSSVEFILTTPIPGMQLPPNSSVVSIQQPFYQMQLSRSQDMQPISLGTLHVQGQSGQNGQAIPILGVQAVSNNRIPIQQSATTTAVATQTSTEAELTDDEPQIVFSTTPKMNRAPVAAEPPKPIPIKKTWRRPWKKKKEREKKQAMLKKSKKTKKKRIIIPKKNAVYIDPKNGPPVDTSKVVIQRICAAEINQLKQKRQRIKLNRNSGREYINRLGKVVGARKIGAPCNCPLKCWDRMGSKVLDIFDNFWDLSDFNLQNSYLFTCLKLCDVKRRYTKRQPAEESRRQNTFEYFVRINGKHIRVCKKAFMSSHGLTSDKRLRTLFTQMKDGALIPEPDRRGKHFRPNKTPSHNSSMESHHPPPTTQTKTTKMKKKRKAINRNDVHKPIYQTQQTAVPHIPHCAPHTNHMQEPPHTYIPNGELAYFPTHYLEPPQTMAPHLNQIAPCQKMLEAPAYFMAGMKENTFHQ